MGPDKRDPIVWYQVTRHPQVFCRLTVDQWTPGFGMSQIFLKNYIKKFEKILKNNEMNSENYVKMGKFFEKIM